MFDNVAWVSQGSSFVHKKKRLVAHVANFVERSIQDLMGKHEGKKLLGKPRHRWEDNNKMCPKGVG